MKNLYSLLISIIAVSFFEGCSKKEETEQKSERTVFVYMAGDNNLSVWIDDNVERMVEGMRKTSSSYRLVCLIDKPRESTRLFDITSSGKKLLKNYGRNLNTADPNVFQSTFKDACSYAPAKRYGCILWSHGSGWLPTIFVNQVKAFAHDESAGDKFMNLEQLIQAFNGLHFDFILCDVCYMASIEFYYALRDKTDYFLAHPTETWAWGYPYHNMVPYFFEKEENIEKALIDMANIYFNFYKNTNNEVTISITKTQYLEELANSVRTANIDFSKVNTDNILQFNATNESGTITSVPIYDFKSVYGQAASNNYAGIENAFKKAVIYEQHTSTFHSKNIKDCCGLNCYFETDKYPQTNSAFKKTDWWKAIQP